MAFQGYLTNIEAKTGKSPDDLRQLAAARGFSDEHGLRKGIKAGAIIAWLKTDFDLGHGHAMAIVALLKSIKREGDS